MAWLKCEIGASVEEKTLTVNKANFPNSSVGIGGCWATSKTENSVRGHSTNGESFSAIVRTGYFDVSGYTSLQVTCSNTTWGMSSVAAGLYLNGVRQCYVSSGTYTIPLNGLTSVEVYVYQSDYDGGGDGWWVQLSMSSIKFVP